MEITYRENENFYVPNLLMPGEEPATYGRFGRMRLKYLKEHRRAVYINLKVSGQLTHYLNKIDREANEMLRLLVDQAAQAQGITEQLKAENQMAWMGAMNNIRNEAEEIVYEKLIGP
jgi:tnpV protein